ncbi:helix-turn-helix domain-containing protein [Longibaculum muris]|uniref:Putative transcriptional regulator n=1 Tax=Longibaculum muris TaxID=1796628 RepID=A0A4R3Z6Z7_9FIRM|nr:helix-turn-helix transcriptional regulator [Longibaculum muris]MCR1886980.1 helix-turn-helix transcriptional regulator [Longibaculum muris]TCW03010.1 putative transcriptional regulator [Longibaculum muris]
MRCRLSTLMGQSRYSIQDVHNKTGLSRSTVAQLYHDKATRIDFDTVEKLCTLFKCDITDLLELEGIKTIKG